jgi:gamma-glutamyl:cysteine ligase YbdK (ATP-grasp superfamily)
MSEDAAFGEQLRRVEALVAAVEATADPAAQASMRELLQAVLDLHGRGLGRILELLGAEHTGQLARDALVSSLLLLHDLHPTDFEERVRQALESVGPKLSAQGCTVVLTSVQDGVVRVRLERRTHGHHASEAALRKLTEEAIWELAPDAEALEIDAAIEPPKPGPVPLVKLRLPSEAGGA